MRERERERERESVCVYTHLEHVVVGESQLRVADGVVDLPGG